MKKIITNILKVLFSMIGTVLVPIIVIQTLWGYSDYRAYKEHISREKFSPEKWTSAYNRIYMYKDLDDNYLSRVITLQKLKDLLGETDRRRHYKSMWGEETCLEYKAGNIGRWGTLGYVLVVCPDKKGKYVRSYKIMELGTDSGETVFVKNDKNLEDK